MIEKYAFITNDNYDQYAQKLWPNAITVGVNYHMVQFADINEAQLEAWVNSLGYDCKTLNAIDMIKAMEKLEVGPFNSNHADAATVVYHFNPPIQIP